MWNSWFEISGGDNSGKGKRRDGEGLDDPIEVCSCFLLRNVGLTKLIEPPGMGKTLTAESITNSTGKPLFSISASDIGTKPEVTERSLRKLFNLATEWEAVRFIDEADVFLNSHGQEENNLQRTHFSLSKTTLGASIAYYDIMRWN
jgi:hypothetical protein